MGDGVFSNAPYRVGWALKLYAWSNSDPDLAAVRVVDGLPRNRALFEVGLFSLAWAVQATLFRRYVHGYGTIPSYPAYNHGYILLSGFELPSGALFLTGAQLIHPGCPCIGIYLLAAKWERQAGLVTMDATSLFGFASSDDGGSVYFLQEDNP